MSKDANECKSEAYLVEDGECIYLGNRFLEFAFDKENGGIFSVVNKSSAIDFRTNKESPCLIYRIWFKTADKKETKCLRSLDADDFAYDWERMIEGIKLTLRSSSLRKLNIRIAVTIFVPDDSNLTSWRIKIENNENFTLYKVDFPLRMV